MGFEKRRIAGVSVGSAAAILSAVGIASAETAVPLEGQPWRLGSFETANVLPQGTLNFTVGTIQNDPRSAIATGNQVYHGGAAYAATDRVSFGGDLFHYQDPPLSPVAGAINNINVNIVSAWGKYLLIQGERLNVAAQVSAEYALRMEYLFTAGRQEAQTFASVKLPITYEAAPNLQFHLTPSASFFPDTIGGAPFYGTVISLGAGVSYKPSARLALYGALDAPVSGDNIVTSAGGFDSMPVATIGARYNVTPKIALDAYVTNGIGTTPATSILGVWPDGDTLLGGVRLTWTPGARLSESYRGAPAALTRRQTGLQQDGFTLGTSDTLDPGYARAAAWYGGDDSYGVMLGFSPDRDVEMQVVYEDYASDGSAPAAVVPTTDPRYMFGPKLRFLDQNNGDAISLSARLLYGRNLISGTTSGGVGVFYGDAVARYQVNDALTISASPKLALWGNVELAGFGVGANFEAAEGLQLVAEAAAVGGDATEPIWAVGARYAVPNTALSVDAMATNAIGRYGIGTMIAQAEPRYTVSVSTAFDLGGLFR